MYLNAFAEGLAPLDMTTSDEFASLLQSAADLGIAHSKDITYRSHNTVLRRHRFHFLEWGTPGAPAVVLFHGGHQSAHSWDLVSLALAGRFHVFALDQRGHGDSEWARDKDYAVETMAGDAAAFIENLGLGRPIVMGHSMGGMVTMTLLKANPELVRAAVLVDVGPEVSEAGAATIRSFVEKSVEFDDLEKFVQGVKAYDPFRSQEHIERTVRYNLLQRTDGMYATKCDRLFRRDVPNRASLSRVTLDEARDFDLPILLVRGERSNILEPEAAIRFADALPQGELVTVPRCGHNVHSQNTQGFLDAVVPFIEREAKVRR